MEAFARFKSKLWCIDPALVDELTEEKSGVEFLLVRQHFDGTLTGTGLKAKDSKETVETFSTFQPCFRKRINPEESGLTRGQSLL